MPKLVWSAFEEKLGTWAGAIQPFFDSGGFESIYEKLKEDSKDGRAIFPKHINTFRCFRETPLESMSVVMMGMCPYHSVFEGKIVADGLLMGCSNTDRCQPSLTKFYEGVEEEIGMNLNHYRTPDVAYLAMQGVLMFNASLTVEMGKAGSHNDIWKPFTTFVFESIIGPSMCPVVFLGKEAQFFDHLLFPMQWGFNLYHPAFAEYRKERWETNGTFTKVNKILSEGGKKPINWLFELPI